MTIVLDTNVLVSSLLAPNGNEAAVVRLVWDDAVAAAISNITFLEYQQVLSRPKFYFATERTKELLHLLLTYSILVHPTHSLALSPDEADNRFLECAEAARANFLITGNKRHLPERLGRTKIVNAREFLDAVDLSR